MNPNVAETSREANAAISLTERKTLTDLIEMVVAQAQRDGAKDMSMREVQSALERRHGRKVDMATISSRVNVMVDGKRLVRDKEHPRPCTVTGVKIQPLSVPPVQERLCY